MSSNKVKRYDTKPPYDFGEDIKYRSQADVDAIVNRSVETINALMETFTEGSQLTPVDQRGFLVKEATYAIRDSLLATFSAKYGKQAKYD